MAQPSPVTTQAPRVAKPLPPTPQRKASTPVAPVETAHAIAISALTQPAGNTQALEPRSFAKVSQDEQEVQRLLDEAKSLLESPSKLKALEIFQRAENFAKEKLDKGHSLIGRCQLGLGNYYLQSNEYVKACNYFENARSLFATKSEDNFLYEACSGFVYCCLQIKQWNDALESAKKVLELSERIGKQQLLKTGRAHFVVGKALLVEKKYDEANEHLNKSSEIFKEQKESELLKETKELLLTLKTSKVTTKLTSALGMTSPKQTPQLSSGGGIPSIPPSQSEMAPPSSGSPVVKQISPVKIDKATAVVAPTKASESTPVQIAETASTLDTAKRLESLKSMRQGIFDNIFSPGTHNKSDEIRWHSCDEELKETLIIVKKIYGEQHPYIGTCLMQMAKTFDADGAADCYEEAKAIFEKTNDKKLVYEIAILLASEKYWETKWSLTIGIGSVGVKHTTKLQRPLDNARQALAVSQELYGENHTNTAVAYDKIAAIYGRMQMWDVQKKYKMLAAQSRSTPKK